MWEILSLLVTSLIVGLAAPAGASPEQAKDDDSRASIKVRFQKSAGLPDWNTTDILIDSKNLTPEQLKRLRNFLEAARFFELKSTLTKLPEGIPDWPAVYTLTVEMNGRKHAVQWDAFIERKELQPLVDWVQLQDLLRQLRENPPRILPPTFPEEIRPIDPGIILPAPLPKLAASKIKVKYVVSGGLLPRVWVDVEIDSAGLTADELRQLKQLIEEAKFFELPAELPQGGGCIPSFSLTTEMDGRRHTVHGIRMAEPESLKRLTEWLEKRSRASAVKVHYVNSGGFPEKVWVADIDSTRLSAEDVRKLRQLIEDGRFFEQPGSFPSQLPVDGMDVTITVEMGGRKHTVTGGQGRLPSELRPLIQWLSDRAVDPTAGFKRLAQDSLPVS